MATIGPKTAASIALLIKKTPAENQMVVRCIVELIRTLYADDVLDKAELRKILAIVRKYGVLPHYVADDAAIDAELAD